MEPQHIFISYELKRIVQSLGQAFQMELNSFGLTNAQVSVLLCLISQDGQSQKDIGNHLNIKAPSLTSLVDQLERKELIVRYVDSTDARAKRIFLTESGKKFLNQHFWPLANQLEDQLLAGFTPEEKAMLMTMLNRMRHNLHKYEHKCT
ncbi:DNA-binding MarR family transcriptional regulator [Caldalkalibacillus uzonensis]|uniref:DNA-binding MarR family transcriptional regulator n=1 Tax=Caldalkalibacillus uzonensis TaxID=353224 RepID=A0ABU0CLE5_9BACI|nr:MarR family transcriptional regulator [Caldalkalibacillus uzonensis]MDQ0337238.1 DNA-binding MarR family transcriptional regulator [Caldalkalibacillus uzonensis]